MQKNKLYETKTHSTILAFGASIMSSNSSSDFDDPGHYYDDEYEEDGDPYGNRKSDWSDCQSELDSSSEYDAQIESESDECPVVSIFVFMAW